MRVRKLTYAALPRMSKKPYPFLCYIAASGIRMVIHRVVADRVVLLRHHARAGADRHIVARLAARRR